MALNMQPEDSSYRALREEAQSQGIRDAAKLRKADLEELLVLTRARSGVIRN